MMYYYICIGEDYVLSNLPDELQILRAKCDVSTERIHSDFLNQIIRHGKIEKNSIFIYLVSCDINMTAKIFKRYQEAFLFCVCACIDLLEKIREKEYQKTRRFKHNITTLAANILQEIYKLVSQDELLKGPKQLERIKEIIHSNSDEAGLTFLKILKNANFMKAEFDVYEIFNLDSPYLDFANHPAHKIILLTINPFWLEFIEKKIYINIDSFSDTIYADYKTISVTLCHIFENATKYIAKNTELHIYFTSDDNYINIIFEMVSLKVYEDEIQKIFLENYSGILAKEYDLAGNGLGMYIVKKLVEFNNGKITFLNNCNGTAFKYDGIEYEKNKIILSLPKEEKK